MLQLIPKRRFSWSFDVTQDGAALGSIELARLKTRGDITVHGEKFALKRDGLLGPIALYANSRIVARAERVVGLRTRYRITAEDRNLDLIGGFMPPAAKLLHGDIVIAVIRRPRLFRRIIHVEALQNAPLSLQLFAAAVMILQWRMATRSASS